MKHGITRLLAAAILTGLFPYCSHAQQVQTGSQVLKVPLTGSIFSDDTPPAIIHRLADRVLIGGAVIADGKRFPVQTTWVAQQASGLMTYFDSRSTFEVVSQRGATAIAAGSRTSDMNPSDTGTVGFLGFALNDYLDAVQTNRRSSWGHYTHVVRAADTTTTGTGGTGGVSSTAFTFSPIPGTAPTVGGRIDGTGITPGTWVTAYNGSTGVATLSAAMTVAAATTVTYSASGGAIAGGIQGMEMDVANLGSIVNVDPYGGGTSQTGMTLDLLLGSGGETGQSGAVVNPASAALLIANNHGQFMKGIVVGANSIYGNDGNTPGQTAPAIVMAKGHEIQWRFSGGDVTPALSAVIRSDNNALATQTKLIFRTNGAAFTDQFENQIGRFQPPATTQGQTTNYLDFIAAIAGSGSPNPVIAATGTDATVGMDFQTTNRGNYNFYNLSHTRLLARIADIGGSGSNGNSIIINGNDSGASPSVAAGGVDTNIDLGFTPKGTGAIVMNAQMKLKSFTVATLPTCNPAMQDAMAAVTDATAPTYNGALIGGGAVHVPVYCNGSAWTSH
ncbi:MULTISPECIES: hypothetical protein [Bradyrhizobium]|jgi:hypothetical protein|uniref:hypothetical protein n=1 Tax=Bradyrhizobium TaxID=374 RepID=UPI0004B07AAC|nr:MULTISPECIES: hypothetical protein [Bradyrhizobium]MCS3451058.1 hypothetical protein [Bradyrhizobium elkanii]MCS3557796.1 hypothetical protein [Bradyrhizobium elkanii]MCW2152357.1 hypothetical protein [Bradyrhizobium elkanii]MCW2357767.1 hypothetical protein [Bradyrhizobium elkanii]MCW2376087.1 hypothetical protein [Bradyrhizobium elkanii]